MTGKSTRDLVEISEDDVSYFKEMLGSSINKLGLGAAVLAMVPAAVVGGPLLAAFPLIAWAGGASIAGLFVPSSPVFRHRVNRRLRSERREELRQRFLEKLVAPDQQTRDVVSLSGLALIEADENLAEVEWDACVERYRPEYNRMVSRLSSLQDIASEDSSGVSDRDVENLMDSTVDYLRLVYARQNLLERLDGSRADEVSIRIADLESQLEAAPPALRAKLERIKVDLERTAGQVAQLPARDAAVAAQLLHMTETFEELYHRITADPAGSNLSSYLNEATAKLSIEEELQWASDLEVSEIRRPMPKRVAQ